MIGFEYVSTLTIDEKILFLKMIVKIISIDGEIDPFERKFINELAEKYQIPSEYADRVHQKVSLDDLLVEAKKLDRHKSLYLIKELLSVANTDNDFDEREIDLVVNVSNQLNIEDEKVAEINQLILDRLNWYDRYNQVMEVNEAN